MSSSKHVDESLNKTQKSFKTDRRDRPKHSGKIHYGPKKSGGGDGKGKWGSLCDGRVFEGALDPRDPNFDELELDQSTLTWATIPSPTSTLKFATSIADYNRFKALVKEALKEFLQSNDYQEFKRILIGLDLTVYHQDLSYILIKYSFDQSDDSRSKVVSLLLDLTRAELMTAHQCVCGIKKLYYTLSDIMVDVPQAHNWLQQISAALISGGLLKHSHLSEYESTFEMSRDSAKLSALKQQIDRVIDQFFLTQELNDTIQDIQALHIDNIRYEFIKRLISKALDRGNQQREYSNQFLSYSVGTTFTHDDVETAFSILLERLEDLHVDVPDCMHLLSVFLARCVIDEVVTPAFLVRVDLDVHDLGSQVLKQAQLLLAQPNAAERLEYIWYELDQQDKSKQRKASGADSK